MEAKRGDWAEAAPQEGREAETETAGVAAPTGGAAAVEEVAEARKAAAEGAASAAERGVEGRLGDAAGSRAVAAYLAGKAARRAAERWAAQAAVEGHEEATVASAERMAEMESDRWPTHCP